jgi:hypothetical protein
MTIAIAICATKNYTYAMCEQVRRIVANLRDEPAGHVILSGDSSAELKNVQAEYQRLMPDGWRMHLIENHFANDENPHYKQEAQLLLMQLRSEAFSCARRMNVDFCWSLDSDVLPPANALRCMKTMLEFDDGYYGVSSCPYPNSLFLGGRGTPQNPIAEDFLPHERIIPEELKQNWDAFQEKLKAAKPGEVQGFWDAEGTELQKKVRECPPDGHIWQVIGKHGWRQRGWLDHAYPAIGKGAVVPSDWCGFGCTLLNRKALDLATFDGYDGKGTEDLFIVWKRWYPAGVRINAITHCPCDHVIWEKKKGGDASGYSLLQTYHELSGEHVGHLRVDSKPVQIVNGFLMPVRATSAESSSSQQVASDSSSDQEKSKADKGSDGNS